MSKEVMSRREFLLRASIGAAGYALICAGVYDYDEILSLVLVGEYAKHAEKTKEYLYSRYGIKVLVGHREDIPVTTETNLNAYELSQALNLVVEEAFKYPKNFFKNNGLKIIRFYNNMKFDGKNAFGYARSDGEIGISYKAKPFELAKDDRKGTFHHEIFHRTEVTSESAKVYDREWIKLHECDCQPYGGGGNPGWFLTKYGGTAPIEERAEFAKYLMRPVYHRQLINRIYNEPDMKTKTILAVKVELMKRYYKERSEGLMNDKYWEDLTSDKIGQGYF